jgi:hypothetical protein
MYSLYLMKVAWQKRKPGMHQDAEIMQEFEQTHIVYLMLILQDLLEVKEKYVDDGLWDFTEEEMTVDGLRRLFGDYDVYCLTAGCEECWMPVHMRGRL